MEKFRNLLESTTQFKNTIGKPLNSYGLISNMLFYYNDTFYLGDTMTGARLSIKNKQIEAYSNFGDTKHTAKQVSSALSQNTPEIKKLKKILLKSSDTILCRSNHKETILIDIKSGKQQQD